MLKHSLSTWMAALFIAGNTVGASILAMPVILGLAGFFPALCMLLLLWGMMVASGLILVHQNTLHKPDKDLVSLYQEKLGAIGKYSIIFGYLFLFYGFSVAYLSATTHALKTFLPCYLVEDYLVLFVCLSLAFIILNGVKIVYRFNAVLMIGLFFLFALLVLNAFSLFESTYLTYQNWAFLPATGGIALGSYGYHNTLPAVSKSLKGQTPKIKQAILLGSSMALCLNVILLLGICGGIPAKAPLSETSLYQAFQKDAPATLPLAEKLSQQKTLSHTSLGFTLLAIITSYLAVATGLIGFIRDLVHPYVRMNKFKDFIFVFLPPLCVVLLNENVFLKAVALASGIGAAFIFGILPACIGFKNKAFGMRFCSLILGLLFLAVFGFECAKTFDWLEFSP